MVHSLLQVTDPGLTFSQLGIGSIVCVLLLAGLVWMSKRLSAAEVRCETKDTLILQLKDDAIGREKEIADRIVPALLQVSELLAIVPSKLDQTLSTARDQSARSELEQVLSRLEQALNPKRGTGSGRG